MDNLMCPICGAKIDYVEERYMMVMDGNSVYQCEADSTHRFWIHPFSHRDIHWHPESSVTNWKSLRTWKILDDGTYTEIPNE